MSERPGESEVEEEPINVERAVERDSFVGAMKERGEGGSTMLVKAETNLIEGEEELTEEEGSVQM